MRQGAGQLSLGKQALAVVQPGTTLKIVQMANWFAYSADKVFLAAAGLPASVGATVATMVVTELPPSASFSSQVSTELR